MPVTSRFFGKVLPTKTHGAAMEQTVQKPGFVDVGGSLDNIFHAMAAGIVDNLLTRPRTNQALLIPLLERHTRYFILPKINGHLITPIQRFEKMAAKPEFMAQLIRDVAYTLRQMAVDELCAHPEQYRAAFEQTPPAVMRKSGTKMHESAIAALANVLKIPVMVNVVEMGKELQKQRHYGPDVEHASYDKIVMQVQRDYYLPQVVQHKRIEQVTMLVTQAPVPLESMEPVDPSLSVILQSIKDADEGFVADFERNVNRLMTMVEAGEVDKKVLLQVYVEGMKRSDQVQGLVKSVDIEHGNQRFFEDAIHNINRPVRIAGFVNNNYDRQVIKALIEALARGISLGQLDENKVFAQIEHAEHSQVTSKVMPG